MAKSGLKSDPILHPILAPQKPRNENESSYTRSAPLGLSAKQYTRSSPSVTQATQGHVPLKALEHALPYLGRR